MNKKHKIEKLSLHIYPEDNYFKKISEVIRSISERNGLSGDVTDIIELSVIEACDNAIQHGSQEGKPVGIDILVDETGFHATVTNTGKEFEFEKKDTFDVNQDFLSYRNGGLGIPLIKKLMDDVVYERTPENMNKLTITKYFKNREKNEN